MDGRLLFRTRISHKNTQILRDCGDGDEPNVYRAFVESSKCDLRRPLKITHPTIDDELAANGESGLIGSEENHGS
jgi:hypothetical protein